MTSTGTLNVAYDPLNNRIRGWVHNGELCLGDERGDLLVDAEQQATRLQEETGATRISLRTLARDPQNIETSLDVEGVLPFSGIHMVYLGNTSSERESHYREAQVERISSMSRHPVRLVDGIYTVAPLINPTQEDLLEMGNLMESAYSRNGEMIMWYNPTPELLSEMVSSSAVSVARHDGRIVSMCIAESADGLVYQGRPLSVFEVSDCATLPEHRRQGLMQGCIDGVMAHPRIRRADLVFSEARAPHIGINQALHNCGFVPRGFLPHHVRIGGERELTETSDMETLVLYGTRDES